MPQIRLLNGGSRTIKVGDPVKIHSTKKNSFDYAQLGDVIIGTVLQDTKPSHWSMIIPITSPEQNILLVEKIAQAITPAMTTTIHEISGPKITISPIEPINPSVGDTWIIPSQT